MERAEAAAVWLRKQDGGLLQSLVVESSGWPRIHKRLRRADAEYFKLPAPEGVVVVLLWSRGLLKDAELLGGLETFEARLEAAWWASRSMEGSGRVDSSTGWRSPKEDVETDWQHLGVLNARQADAVGRQFGLDDGKSGVSEPLDEQAMKWLGLSFPGADVFGQEGDVSRPNQSGMQDSGNE